MCGSAEAGRARMLLVLPLSVLQALAVEVVRLHIFVQLSLTA